MTEAAEKIVIHADLGSMDYRACLGLQKRALRLRQQGRIGDCLLLVEHDHVFTIGRSGSRNNLLLTDRDLAARGISCVAVDRGGDITYHGPGQLVVYPIVDLRRLGIGVADFISELEGAMTDLLARYGLTGGGDARNRGVWLGDRKIGFVGIAVRQGVSMHGLALNVAVDLGYFAMMHPCGLRQVGITSMAEHLAAPPAAAEAGRTMSDIFARRLPGRRLQMDRAAFTTLMAAEEICNVQQV